jgi:hypothetical protein
VKDLADRYVHCVLEAKSRRGAAGWMKKNSTSWAAESSNNTRRSPRF